MANHKLIYTNKIGLFYVDSWVWQEKESDYDANLAQIHWENKHCTSQSLSETMWVLFPSWSGKEISTRYPCPSVHSCPATPTQVNPNVRTGLDKRLYVSSLMWKISKVFKYRLQISANLTMLLDVLQLLIFHEIFPRNSLTFFHF